MSILKKIFIISGVFFLLFAVFGGIYNFAFKEKSPDESDSTSKKDSPFVDSSKQTSSEKKTQTEILSGKIYPVTDEPVISPSISKDGEEVVYYSRINGKVNSVSFRGTGKETISGTELPGLVKVLWSPKKDKVISIYNKSGATEKYYFNYETQAAKRLPDSMESITWSNIGDKIFYKFYDKVSQKNFISISDPDGSNWSNLAESPWKNTSLSQIPQTSIVSFWNYPNGFEETSLRTISIAGGEEKTVFGKKFGADYLWSPNGEKALVSSSDSKGSSKVTLALINKNGGEYQNLNIPTLASKCAWSNDSKFVYYALPGSIPDGSVMPNDYQDKKFTTKDSFWKVDIATGKQERLLELSEIKDSFDATNLFLSPTESMLFFVNRIDNKLYGIEI